QSGNLVEHLSVAQNIRAAQAFARRARRARRPRLAGGDAGHVGVRRDVLRLAGDVGLAGRASARPGTLSGGEAARAALAVALANDPPVLLADEPTGEIDQQAEHTILELLRERARRGKAVLVVTHSQSVAAAADRVIQMADGRIGDV